MKIKLLALFVLAALLGFTACKSKKAATESAADRQEITGKHWNLVELNGKSVATSSKAFILLNKADGRFNGTGGCNSLFGSFEMPAPTRVRFTQILSTQKACLTENYDSELARVLETCDNYSISEDGKKLLLNRARMAPLAVFELQK